MALARPIAAWLGTIAGPLSPRRLAGLRWLFIDMLFSQAAVSLCDDFVSGSRSPSVRLSKPFGPGYPRPL